MTGLHLATSLRTQVRRKAAERLYVAIISLDNVLSDSAVDSVIDFLTMTPWYVENVEGVGW
jgi:uncharacterized protein (DUF2132 family)